MAALVPGVTKVAPSTKHNGTSRSGADPAALDREWASLKSARAELQSQRTAFEAERAALQAERAALLAEKEALQALQAAVGLEREAVRSAQQELEGARSARLSSASPDEAGPPSMMDMFDGRGLKGVDEAERALAALAGAKAMGRLLEQVKVREPDALRRLLWERLVLVGGSDIPEELDVPSVIVSQERADIPGAFELSRRCNALGEQLMLNGLVRVVLVGIARRWHSLLRARIDPRITLGFRPAPLSADMVAESSDPRRLALVPMAGDAPLPDPAAGVSAPVDALLVWAQEPIDEGFLRAVEGRRTRIVSVPANDLASWLEAATEAVASGASP